jgi:hypothetical protein
MITIEQHFNKNHNDIKMKDRKFILRDGYDWVGVIADVAPQGNYIKIKWYSRDNQQGQLLDAIGMLDRIYYFVEQTDWVLTFLCNEHFLLEEIKNEI